MSGRRPGCERPGRRGARSASHEISQHARVDPVGLAGERRDGFDLARISEADIPTDRGELIADPHGAAHHLDAAAHLAGAKRERKPGQAILLSRDRTLSQAAVLADRAPTRATGSPIDAELLHEPLLASRSGEPNTA